MNLLRTTTAAFIVSLGWLTLMTVSCSVNQTENLVISVAANLQPALEEMTPYIEKEIDASIAYNYGASGKLAQQIEQGAPVDVFLSANVSYIDELITIGRLKPDSKRIFAHGRLVLWAPTIDLPLETLADLQRPEIKSIALANPNHAPYGMAMKDALIAAGVWDSLTDKLIFGEDVSQCYHYAVTGNVDVAIIPFSFIASKASGHWMEIPDSLYPPLEQTAAITTKTPNQALAQRFIELLTSPKAQETLTSHGYILPPNEVAEP